MRQLVGAIGRASSRDHRRRRRPSPAAGSRPRRRPPAHRPGRRPRRRAPPAARRPARATGRAACPRPPPATPASARRRRSRPPRRPGPATGSPTGSRSRGARASAATACAARTTAAGVQVGRRRRRGAEPHDPVGQPGRQRVEVGVGGGEHRLDAQPRAGADHPGGDLAAVGDRAAGGSSRGIVAAAVTASPRSPRRCRTPGPPAAGPRRCRRTRRSPVRNSTTVPRTPACTGVIIFMVSTIPTDGVLRRPRHRRRRTAARPASAPGRTCRAAAGAPPPVPRARPARGARCSTVGCGLGAALHHRPAQHLLLRRPPRRALAAHGQGEVVQFQVQLVQAAGVEHAQHVADVVGAQVHVSPRTGACRPAR